MRVLRALLLFTLMFGLIHCKKKEVKKKAELEKYKVIPNICENENRNFEIVCNCDLNDYSAALEANCFVISNLEETGVSTWGPFSSQPNLRQLKFSVRSGGTFPIIPTEMMKHVRHLELLEIKYGTINDITPYAFANSSHLKELILASNSIARLHPNAFSHLQSLESVNLDDNRIGELQPMVFHHVPNLRKLFLTKVNLSIIHDNAFRFLNHLHELELHSNMISVITRETFNGLFRLKRLDLTSNRLTMIGDYTFAEMTELEELELDHNSIEFVSDNAFGLLNNLKRLRLANNKLKSLSDVVFDVSKEIQFLDLRDNGMAVLKFRTLEPLWENFKNSTAHLLIDGNHFPCDCHLSWAYSLSKETPNTQILESLKELTCVSDGLLGMTEEPILSGEQQDDQFNTNGVVEYDDDVEYYDLPEESGPPQQRLLQIPLEQLPCPETLKATSEDPQNFNFPPLVSPSNSNSSRKLSFNFMFLVICIIKIVFLT